MSNSPTPIRADLNIRSPRKYPNGLIGAQVILFDEKDNRTYYACRAKRVGNTAKIDASDIWVHANGG